MSSTVTTIIVAILASKALFDFIQFVITRRDTKKNLKDELKKIERDVLRTQLLVLIVLKPEEEQEILTLAEHYFKVLNGDWYLTSIFNRWLTETDTAQPEWFNDKK